MSLICQLTSEDIKHHYIIFIKKSETRMTGSVLKHERHRGPSSPASLGTVVTSVTWDRRHQRHRGLSSPASQGTVVTSVTWDQRHGHSGGGASRTHKLRFPLLSPQSCRVTPLKPGVGQIICRSKDIKGSRERCLLGQNTTCQFSVVIPFIKPQNDT